MKKRIAAFLLAMILVLSVSVAVQAEIDKSLLNMDSLFPTTKEPFTLKLAASYDSAIKIDFTTGQQFWQLMEKKSGITVDWQLYANEVWNEQKSILLASGDYPDIFFFPFSAGEVKDYGMNQGILMPLTEFLNDSELTPNINRVFDKWPELKAALTLPDGNIYTLGYAQSKYNVTANAVRTKWIMPDVEAANVDVKSIATLDELYDVLLALRDADYNGNGAKDEIPWGYYTGVNNDWYTLMEYVLNAYGFAGKNTVMIDTRENKAVYAPLTEQYKAAVEFLDKCYVNGILDSETFTQVEADYVAKCASGVYVLSSHYNPAASIPADLYTAETEGGYQGEYVYYPVPVVNEAGQAPVATGTPSLGLHTCAIAATCKHPEVAIRWLDCMCDPYMSLMFRQGPEYGSEDMIINNGWDYNEEATNITGANMLARSGLDNGWHMWLTVNNFAMGSVGFMGSDQYYGLETIHPDMLTKKARAWTAVYEENIMPYEKLGFPSVFYTDEQQEFIDTYVTDIDTYALQMTAQFITGAKSMDEYPSFIDGLTALRAVEYNDMLAEIYDRFM